MNMVKTRKMTASFFLALLLLTSFNTIVSAEEKEEITAYPGQIVRNNKLGFENTGAITIYDVYAVASGSAADWVSPTTIHFGTVYPGEDEWKTYTIKVPEDAIVGSDYTLIWSFYSEDGYEDSLYYIIHVRAWTPLLLIPWWIWIIIILVLAIVIPGIVIGVVVSRKKKPPPPPPEATPPETTEGGEV